MGPLSPKRLLSSSAPTTRPSTTSRRLPALRAATVLRSALLAGRRLPATPKTRHLVLLDALMGCVAVLVAHPRPRTPPSLRAQLVPPTSLRTPLRQIPPIPALPSTRRLFHNYFVTHLPSSSLHPDSRRGSAPHHKLPRDASVPHTPSPQDNNGPPPVAAAIPASSSSSSPVNGTASSGSNSSSSMAGGFGRDLTVVRIPLRSAKHHFGAYNARGSRPYNEDTNQAGTIAIPAFAKRAPISLVRSAISNSRSSGEGITADGAAGDPQIFYFGVFDGHGGSECSEFLRDELHTYIEEAATAFGLTSSLRRKSKSTTTTATTGTGEDATAAAVALQTDLLKQYRDTVGGYFRRFKPATFSDDIVLPSRSSSRSSSVSSASSTSSSPTPPVTIESVLTYAFLRADLDFISAQARKPDPDDPYVADFPLNQDEVLGAPHARGSPSRGAAGLQNIGGHVRFKGGSTASVALISTPTPAPFWHPSARSSLLVAHVGDTRVLLCETATGLARPLTRDHHPSSPVEARRLTRFAESLVTDSFGEERISGLANSRAFGDMQSKRIGVTAEPELERVDMGPAQFAFLVLVSDGVSGTLGDQEIVDVVKDARTPEQGARDVVEYATEVSHDGDNATCLVVRLGGWERRSEGGLGSLGTKEIREARRAEANDPRRGRQ